MAKTAVAELALDRSASHLLHRALQLALDIYGAETGPGAVTQRQFAVLAAAAARDGCTQSDLVKATGIDRSTLAELVGRLTTRGLIARERSTSDGRANTVRLTDAGRAILDGVAPGVAAADARILGLLPAGKRDSFLKILREMGRPPEPKAKKIKAEKADKAEKKKKKKAKKAKRHEGAGEAAVV
jgi:MarR family transcriptional regulator, temperature-dependent positive regulator of motility